MFNKSMYESKSILVLADLWAGRSSTDYSLQTSPSNCQGGQILRCLLLSECQIRFVIIISNASWRGSMEMWSRKGSFSFYICMINIWESMGLPQSYVIVHQFSKLTLPCKNLIFLNNFYICRSCFFCCITI